MQLVVEKLEALGIIAPSSDSASLLESVLRAAAASAAMSSTMRKSLERDSSITDITTADPAPNTDGLDSSFGGKTSEPPQVLTEHAPRDGAETTLPSLAIADGDDEEWDWTNPTLAPLMDKDLEDVGM